MLFYIKLNWIILVDMLLRFPQACTPHTLSLIERLETAEDTVTFRFKPNRPVRYQAGQYGIWFLHGLVKGKPARLFTVASGPETGYIELSTHISKSDFKQKLNKLRVGERVTMFGPVGRFTLPKQQSPAVVYIAGGIGITPVHAIAQSTQAQKIAVPSTLLHVGHPGAYLYQSEMTALVSETSYIERKDLDQALQAVLQANPSATYYVSGPPAFVKSVTGKLHTNNIRHVKIDGFLGY